MSEIEQSNGIVTDTDALASHAIEVAEVPELDTQPLPPSRLAVDVEVVVAGHICLNIIPTLTTAVTFTPGRLIGAGKAVVSPGGSVANTGLALHKVGITTRLMGRVGDDLFGGSILQLLNEYGKKLAASMVVAPGETSSYSIVLTPPGSERIIIHAPGSNDAYGADDLPYEELATSGLFHFGHPPLMARMYNNDGEELTQLFRRVKEQGITTSLDISLPDPNTVVGQVDWQKILSATLPYVDIFLPGIEELLQMLQRPLYEKLAAKAGKVSLIDLISPSTISELGRTLLDFGAKIVAIKLGHRGLYLCTANLDVLERIGRAQPAKLLSWSGRELWAPCFVVDVVGTLGAGDATIAGFLMGMLRGMNPEETLSAACAVGACSVEAIDPLSGIPSWPNIMERIAEGWPRLMPEKKGRFSKDMDAYKWRWEEAQEVWIGPADRLATERQT